MLLLRNEPAMAQGVTLEQIRTLLSVAEEGSFSGAARKLGRVQAAVSQSIHRLESQLGLRLFDRSSRSARLTARGEAVVAAALRIAGEAEHFDRFVEDLKRGHETELSIVVDSMFPSDALVTFAREFGDRYPSVDLTVRTETLSAAAALVRDRWAAIGIAGTDTDLSDLEQRHIVDIRMIPVVAPSHPLARVEGMIEDTTLADHVQIVLSERSESKAHGTTGPGIFSTKTWRVVDLMTKHALLVGGVGWGHEPEHIVHADLRQGRLVELHLAAWQSNAPRRSLSLVYRKRGSLGPIARAAGKRLTSLCQETIESRSHHTT